MTVNLLYFGSIRETAGVDGERVELADDATVADVRQLLAARLPGVKGLLEKSAIAVNQSYVAASHALAEEDEVAILPPVSGGGDCFV